MASEKRETYTDLLIREICTYLTWAAANSSCSSSEADALYKAARLVGRNQNQFVSRVLRQMNWRDALEKAPRNEASSVG